MNERLYNSFNGGEISPELFSRSDTQLFRMGASKLRNWVCKTSGAATIRPGFEYRGATFEGKKARLIPFAVDGDDFIIEMTAGKFRFWRSGELVGVDGGPKTIIKCGNQDYRRVLDEANDAIYTVEPHGLVDDDKIRVLVDTSLGHTYPQGVAAVFEYYAIVVSANCIQLAITPGGAAVNIGPSQGTGDLYLVKVEDVLDYEESFTLVSINQLGSAERPSESRINLSADPLWGAGTPFVWDEGPGGSAPPFRSLGYATSWSASGNPIPYDGRTFRTNEATQSQTIDVEQDDSRFAVGESFSLFTFTNPMSSLWTAPVYCARYFPQGTVVWHGLSELGGPAKDQFYLAKTDTFADQPNSRTKLASDWTALGEVPYLVIDNPFTEDELFEVNFAQNQNRLRFAHRKHRTFDLVRTAGVFLKENSLDTEQAALNVNVTANFGQQIEIASTDAPTDSITTRSHHGLTTGELIYIRGASSASIPDGFYTVGQEDSGATINKLYNLDGSIELMLSTTDAGAIIPAASTANTRTRYIVSALDAGGREYSASDATAETFNILANNEAYNEITWSSVAGAASYRVYKEVDGTGLFGLLTNATTTSFRDFNVDPDYGTLSPNFDEELESDYPGSVAFYDQRGVFGGNAKNPQTVWLTSLGQPRQMVSRVTQIDSDRIRAEIAAREGQSIRHLVPASDLLILTDVAEWALLTQNTDALTPTSVTFRTQSTIGSSAVRPLILDNSVLLTGRDNHVHRLSFDAGQNSFGGSDLSIRAGHFFDKTTIQDVARTRTNSDFAWFVDVDGNLTGLTYSEQENVAGWHQHRVDDYNIVSVTSAREGEEDRLYAVVEKNGQHEIVRLHSWVRKTMTDSGYLDRSLRFELGKETKQAISVKGSALPGSTVKIVADGIFPLPSVFPFDAVGKVIYFPTTKSYYRVTEREAIYGAELTAEIIDGGSGTPTSATDWDFAVTEVFADWLGSDADLIYQALDGTLKQTTVSFSNAKAILPEPAIFGVVGQSYSNELRTMPVTLQIPATGLGFSKAISQVAYRLYDTGGLKVGPTVQDATEVYSDFELRTGETRDLVLSEWSGDGTISFTQHRALPCTVASIILDVNVGG